jgi:hypothetical protein
VDSAHVRGRSVFFSASFLRASCFASRHQSSEPQPQPHPRPHQAWLYGTTKKNRGRGGATWQGALEKKKKKGSHRRVGAFFGVIFGVFFHAGKHPKTQEKVSQKKRHGIFLIFFVKHFRHGLFRFQTTYLLLIFKGEGEGGSAMQ